MNSFISERVIEDILATDKSILSDVLSVRASDLSLIARHLEILVLSDWD